MTISVRIVNIDHYMAKPGPFDRSFTPFSEKKLTKVPIIRVFGSTLAGQKLCLHIHQVYPYFFTPYAIPKEFTTEQEIQKDIFQFGTSLNEAMNIAKPNAEKNQHIVAIVLTKGVPFYGYHVEYQSYLKIYITNPKEKQQMLDLLQSEAIMGTRFQPFEAHINFELQFLIDHNLYGMDWLHIDEDIGSPVFRLPLLQEPKSSFVTSQDSNPIYTSKTIPDQQKSNIAPRESYCELEMDIIGMSILNRLDLNERDIHSSLHQEAIIQQEALLNPQQEAKKKLVKSLEIIWKDETNRRKARNILDPIPPVSQTDERESHLPWNTEPSLRKLMEKMLSGNHQLQDEPSPLLSDVMTVFQAVEALYPEEYNDWKQQKAYSSQVANEPLQTTPRCVTPPRNSQQKSLQFNVSATPTRYRDWEIPSQLDKSIIDSLIRDPSFHEEREGEEVEEVPQEDDYFSQFDQLSNSAIAKWMEAQETIIEYEPRKLDFLAESQRIDTILQTSSNQPKRNIFNTDIEDLPFEISNIPPIPGPRKYRKKRRINQLDGPNDQHESKKQKTSAEKWELQRQQLKRMRQRKSIPKTTELPPPVKKPSSDQNKIKSDLIKKKYRKLEATFSSKQEKGATIGKSIPVESAILIPPLAPEAVLSATGELSDNKIAYSPESQDIYYFTKRIDGMWSPQEERKTSSSFFHSPPIPTSPENLRPSPHNHPAESTLHITHNLSIDTLPSLSLGNSRNDSSYNSLPLHATRMSAHAFTKELIYNHKPPMIHVPNTIVYKEPFYSKEADLPPFPTVFSGKEYKLPTNSINSLKEFKTKFSHTRDIGLEHTRIKHWSPALDPPTFQQVKEWSKNKNHKQSSQLDKPTMNNTFDFKLSATKPQTKIKPVKDFIDYFSLEIHVNTRKQLLPDPQQDPVQVIFWCLQTQDQCIPSNGYQGYHVGIIALKNFDITKVGLSSTRAMIDYADNEEDLFTLVIEKIRYYDPDMLVGYEVQNSSWGYLVERGAKLGIHLLDELSRVSMTTDSIKKDQWGYQKTSVYKVCGRHILNIWRLMKGEITLTSYTFENVAYHLLHDRVPHYSHETLTTWYSKGPAVLKYRLFKYYLKRIQMNLDILDASQVVIRTCESARVFGVDFYSVLSRGSQYKVESIMFRIAKPENFVLITPSRKQVASQRSLECLPLVMEPISQFYSSPLVVLDFQSLYPSIIIAYNYCYSTCLGRVRDLEESSRFGIQSSFDLKDGLLDSLKDNINISPNGIMFVKPEIRKSLLAKMLAELLDTRVMIKRTMKDYKEDSGLLRMLDAKQLTLKLLANVTYGYTSASFSGRMPSVEIADSIVSAGRETLERSIKVINETKKWGARVVYGDTDSVFVYFPGKTKDEAFILGNEIADTITKLNPAPMKLKFEKVYHPAVLLAKKRYVGFKYENQSNTEPLFEAKGIETVRRDGTAATQKILESCLKILFRSQDMSELKQYLYNQWTKILSNRVLLQEFVISKEVKMGSYSSRGGPNGAQIAQAQMDADTRAEPQYGERVPYVVVYRGPKSRLKDKVVRPEEVLADNTLKLDAEYYIRKQIIPPLSRVFNLMGVDIESWYDSMPRSQKAEALGLATIDQPQNQKITRIDQYYASSHCIVCRQIADQVICQQCQEKPYDAIFTLTTRQQQAQDKFRSTLQTCQDCSGISPLDAMSVQKKDTYADIPCNSLDCPIFYERCKAKQDVKVTSNYNVLLESFYD